MTVFKCLSLSVVGAFLCVGLGCSAPSPKPEVSPIAAGKATAQKPEELGAAPAVAAPAEKLSECAGTDATGPAHTYRVTKVTVNGPEPMDEADEEGGGDCAQPHLWIEVVGIQGGQAVCRAAYGQGIGWPMDATSKAKAAGLEGTVISGQLNRGGQCWSYFEAARSK
jgi:hypothetical protein